MAMGRPKKQIDRTLFEKLCGIQCTEEEICAVLDVSTDTLSAWCKKEYRCTFSEVAKKKRDVGKMSLRRSQFKLAEKNATMSIWLGKQYLGQVDRLEARHIIEDEDDALSKAFERLQSGNDSANP